MLFFNLSYIIPYWACRNFNTFCSNINFIINNLFWFLFLIAILTKNYAVSKSNSTSMMQVAFNFFKCKRQHALLLWCFEPLQLQHFFCCDNVTRSFSCSFYGCGSRLNHSSTHFCGFVLVGINCLVALVPCIAVDYCFLLFLADAAEFFPTNAVFVFNAPVELFTAQLFHGLKNFCDGFGSCGKLLLIFFFYFSIDFAAANSLRKLLCFSASNMWEMLGFSISLNFSMRSSTKVSVSSHNLNNQW